MTLCLENRVAIITGAAQGLGYAIAETFLRQGARVAFCARTAADVERARLAFCELATSQRVLGVVADVAVEAQAQQLIQATYDQFGQIDVLVNNAGVYGPLGPIEGVDWQEWVAAMQVNVLGSVLMSRLVLPHMKQAGRGKIIQLSGGGATNPLPNISAYAASKAAIVRFAETLAEEVRPYHIDVNAIAPGALNTRLLDQVLEAGADRVGPSFFEKAQHQKQTGGAPLEKGVALAVYLASAASDGVTGKLISALWDPWPQFEAHLDEMNHSDVYTLRRIVPADRGMKWGEEQA